MKRRLCLGFLTFLSIGVALFGSIPWVFGLVETRSPRSPLLEHLVDRFTAAPFVFVLHVVGGAVALATGPWQLIPRLRARRPRLHRAMGYAYVSAVVVAGIAGLDLARTAWGGPAAQLGFTALAVAWLTTTGVGLQRILSGDRTGHRVWMSRSFALAFAAVSLRLQVPLFAALGVPATIAYPIVAWSSWVPNLALAVGLRDPRAGRSRRESGRWSPR